MKTTKELIYNVYFEDFNARQIVTYNIFRHSAFYEALINTKKKYKEDFEGFADAVKKALMHCFWSKSEYEIILTSWPPYVEADAIDKVVKERDEHIKQYNNFYRNIIKLEVAEKVDIYDQVLLNWDIFIEYLWNHRDLIRAKKVSK